MTALRSDSPRKNSTGAKEGDLSNKSLRWRSQGRLMAARAPVWGWGGGGGTRRACLGLLGTRSSLQGQAHRRVVRSQPAKRWPVSLLAPGEQELGLSCLSHGCEPRVPPGIRHVSKPLSVCVVPGHTLLGHNEITLN